jgi:regulator of replication initiation timing
MVKAMGVVKELNADIDRLRDRHGELCAENARLKAEVEELQRLLTAATFYKNGGQP